MAIMLKFFLIVALLGMTSGVCVTGCPQNNQYFVLSDTTTNVISPNMTENSAVLNTYIHPNWWSCQTHNNGASWISDEPHVLGDAVDKTIRYFYKTLSLACPPTSVSIQVMADNEFTMYINGILIPGTSTSSGTFNTAGATYNVTPYFNVGPNVVQWKVVNDAQTGGNWQNNPTGLCYSINISV